MPKSRKRRPQPRSAPARRPQPRVAASSARARPDDAGAEAEASARPVGGKRTEPTVRAPVETGRVTRPKLRGPFRPTWHKVTGTALILLGLTVFILNDLALFEIEVMPGGHSELWAPVAIAIAASSMWWFGWFDRPPGQRR